MSPRGAEDREIRSLERALARGARARVEPEAGVSRDREIEALADTLAAELAELASTPAVRPPIALRERVLAIARPESRLAGLAERFAELLDWPIERARGLLAESGSLVRDEPRGESWIDGPGAGIRIRPLAPGARHGVALAGLVWCAPGSVFPQHRHHGPEWALVLSGEATDSGGTHWSVGDLVAQSAGSHHCFEIPGEGIPLLAAVVVRRGFEFE